MRYGWRSLLVHLTLLWTVLAPAPAFAAGKLIWAFGDSLTAGYGLPPGQGFTSQLQQALNQAGVDVAVRNGGIAGDTAAQGRARLLWGLRGLGARPDLVIVELGANDMLRGLPVAQARTNLDLILTELRRRQLNILLVGMKAPPNLGADYRRQFDAIYPALAKRHDVPFYPFFLDGVVGRRALIQPDGLHPNRAGVAVIVKGIMPVVRSALRHRLTPPRIPLRNIPARD